MAGTLSQLMPSLIRQMIRCMMHTDKLVHVMPFTHQSNLLCRP